MVFCKIPEGRVAEMLNEFCQNSMFTFEGIDIEGKNGKDFKMKFEAIARRTGFKEKEMIGYVFKGKHMNEIYRLTGDNAYPDDLTFVSIPNYYNPFVKLEVGARWFDDIVANNAIRENAQHFCQEPDYS